MNRNKKLFGAVVVLLMLAVTAPPLLALEVDREVAPRITLGGRLISTFDHIAFDSNPAATDHISLEDSMVILRFDKHLYKQGVAGAVLGIEEEDDVTRFQQLHAFYWTQDMKLEMGRTRLRNTLIEFPLLRDEDLLSYTHVGNASSNEKFDQIYGELISVDWFLDRRVQRLGVWVGSRRNDPGFPVTTPAGLDSQGVSYVYEQSQDLFYVARLRHAGIRLDRQQVDKAGVTKWQQALLAGIEMNINMDPQFNWSLSAQAMINQGIDGAASLATGADQAQAASQSLVTSIRYAARPHLLTRWQAALTLAVKDYSDIADASQWTVAPSLFYRIGQGVDLLAQASYTDYSAAFGGGSDTRLQLGMVFSLETVFNNNIGERDSILNLEHGFIQ